MQLTYGYDLKQNDAILIPPRRSGEVMSTFILPGAALVNHLPFRAVPLSPTLIWLSHGIFSQTHTFLDFIIQV